MKVTCVKQTKSMNAVYVGHQGRLIYPRWQQPLTDYTSKQYHRLVMWFFVGLNLLLSNPIKKLNNFK